MKKVPELLILFALFVSPLLHNSIEDSFQTRRMWSWCLLISLAIIAFFLSYPFRVQKIFSYLFIALGGLAISSFFIAVYPVNSLAVYLVILVLLLSLASKLILQNNSKNTQIFAIMFLGFCSLYAQWGIAQFIVQHDLGMNKLGESILNQNTPGIASFYIQSEKFIRAYGPFAHANSFAGVLLLGVIVLYRHTHKFTSSLFTLSIFFIISLGIFTTFSRTALLGLGTLVMLFLYKKKLSLVFPSIIIILLFASLLFYRSVDTRGVAVHDRMQGLAWFTDIENSEVFLRGTGLGNYTTVLKNYLHEKNITYNAWDIAPIHSVPLFLFAELGIIVWILLMLCVARYVYINKALLFIVLLPALFFDHYFVTQLAPLLFLIISAQMVVQ